MSQMTYDKTQYLRIKRYIRMHMLLVSEQRKREEINSRLRSTVFLISAYPILTVHILHFNCHIHVSVVHTLCDPRLMLSFKVFGHSIIGFKPVRINIFV